MKFLGSKPSFRLPTVKCFFLMHLIYHLYTRLFFSVSKKKNCAEGGGDWWIENIRNILGNYDNVSDVLDSVLFAVGDEYSNVLSRTCSNERANETQISNNEKKIQYLRIKDVILKWLLICYYILIICFYLMIFFSHLIFIWL